MIDIYDKAMDLNKRYKENSEKVFKEKSLHGLQKLAKKRCTTIFIGSLDSIEQKIGYLWGNGKQFEQLTEREKLFLQLWKDLRKEILDKGNTQIKILLNELANFEVVLKNRSYILELES